MTLQHYVLFKLKDSASSATVTEHMLPFVAKMSAIPGVFAANFSQNSYQREGNFDMMLQISLQDAQALQDYIDHPLHKSFSSEIRGFIQAKVKFDRLMS